MRKSFTALLSSLASRSHPSRSSLPLLPCPSRTFSFEESICTPTSFFDSNSPSSTPLPITISLLSLSLGSFPLSTFKSSTWIDFSSKVLLSSGDCRHSTQFLIVLLAFFLAVSLMFLLLYFPFSRIRGFSSFNSLPASRKGYFCRTRFFSRVLFSILSRVLFWRVELLLLGTIVSDLGLSFSFTELLWELRGCSEVWYLWDWMWAFELGCTLWLSFTFCLGLSSLYTSGNSSQLMQLSLLAD